MNGGVNIETAVYKIISVYAPNKTANVKEKKEILVGNWRSRSRINNILTKIS